MCLPEGLENTPLNLRSSNTSDTIKLGETPNVHTILLSPKCTKVVGV